MASYSIIKQPSEVMTEIAVKVRNLRKESGYSQVELADRSGVSLGSLKRFEQTGQISLESFLKLLHILKRLEEFNSILNLNDELKNAEHLFSFKFKK
ncbi:MAG TPA: XRE family transcriptional regulator [Prolixibacteraceae bacterium]|nr:XRE family transcriptional regulator [Prolixibacteraceae bacterium]